MFTTPSHPVNKKICVRASRSAESKECKKNESILREIASLDQSKMKQSMVHISRNDTIVSAEQVDSDISSICSEEEDEDEIFLFTPSSKTTKAGQGRESFLLTPIVMECTSSFSLTPRRTPDTSILSSSLTSPTRTPEMSVYTTPDSRLLPNLSPCNNKRKRRYISTLSIDELSREC
jgi:hypothetical protein